ncbi:hypothetical protein DNL40_11130 [Xylanimonas oleitrophica]|uniref:Aminoglycoside phosphotransferase domain-containing protein n=1 Tax=Xylanimonas oleitrophica TaxID=2607479 RepID=A0A2W5Y416_9MICO|nr:phosphotransferase [Xylanimonas oleitrophica]PZR52654.1 hypothetical protein DNL40_11130 [Xylanimonas oleitrophica]
MPGTPDPTREAVARLVAADPHLPALPLALDDDLLADLLAAHGRRLLRRRAVRYKPGTSVVVTLDLDDGPAWLLGTTPDAAAKVAKTVRRAPAGSVIAADPAGMLLARPAADRDLPGARDPEGTVRRLLPGLAQRPHTVRTLVHNAQRRWVALVEAPDAAEERVLLRAHRPGPSRQHHDALLRVATTGLVPPPLAYSEQHATLAVGFVPGEPLDEALARGAAGAHELRAAGRALARVHQHHGDGLPVRTRGDHAASARQVAALLPHLADRVAAVVEAVDAGLASAEAHDAAAGHAGVLRHGDFSADQVVLRPDGTVALVDWDEACTGPAGDDLAGAAAAGLDGGAVEALHTGYAEVRPLPGGLPARTAAALLRRAPEPFRHAETAWAERVEQVLARAEEVLRHDR